MKSNTVLKTDSVYVDGRDTVTDGSLSDDVQRVERTTPGQEYGRDNMREWMKLRESNVFDRNKNLQHTLRFHLGDEYGEIENSLSGFGAVIPTELDAAVTENDFRLNVPRIDPYNGIGERIDHVVHHPSYTVAGDIIYGTEIVKKLGTLGGLRDGMAFYLMANHIGEAGHNCPVICNYEVVRVLRLVEDFKEREEYIRKLEEPSYTNNYTSSQFLTEVQGGSDVGANDTRAWQDDDGNWFIRGEKWFCSNANAELMVISARRSMDRKGTKGLSMFLIPAIKPDGSRNDFTMRRLKEKLGTRALASAEIDYHDAYAIPLGDNFNFMLEKVVHHSRIALAVAVLGFSTRALQFSYDFARTRYAFGSNILQYPLVKENLATIKSDITACLAGTYDLIALQDKLDTEKLKGDEFVAFARMMVNIGKSVISKRTVDNVHHCIDGIGGNGAIENMSSLPRLMRDSIILENWEGTHNTLYMQLLRDIHRYQHDKAYIQVMNGLIDQLSSSVEKEKAQAMKHMESLESDLDKLKSCDEGQQSLMIKDVATDMANLYYYVVLLLEGCDQLEVEQQDNKLKCAALFYGNNISTDSQPNDAEYIALCDAVLSAE